MTQQKMKYIVLLTTLLLLGCQATGDHPGFEYSPNMYHSVAYEPLKQITDTQAGTLVNSLDNGKGEYYNSIPYNPFRMNMREPAKHTVKRNKSGWLPYRLEKDDFDEAAAMQNPFPPSPELLKEGKLLYTSYCQHCHGAKGEGEGKVATGVIIDGVEKGIVAGVANLQGDAYRDITEGHIFHVITWGRNLMQPHGSQIAPEDRWKIAMYVKNTLQKKKK